MARHFAFEKLSKEAQALAIRLYEDEATLREVVEAIRETTGEEIAQASLHRYLRSVVDVETRSRQAIKRRIQAMIEATRADPNCTEGDILKALSYEAALARRDDLDTVDLKTLIQEQRRREEGKGRMEIEQAKIELDRARLDHERQILEFKKQVGTQAAAAADEVQRVVKSNGLSDAAAAEIRAKILGVAS